MSSASSPSFGDGEPTENASRFCKWFTQDITQTKDGNMMVTGQWFYRPDEAERKGGGNWQSRSYHRDEVPAESVMHKCVVHFFLSSKRSGQTTKAETPGGFFKEFSLYTILWMAGRWMLKKMVELMRLTLQAQKTANGSEEQRQNGKSSFLWPDDAVSAVAALEKASHEILSSDFHKYNQKMRLLQFNLKVLDLKFLWVPKRVELQH